MPTELANPLDQPEEMVEVEVSELDDREDLFLFALPCCCPST